MKIAWIHSMRFMRRDGAVFSEAMVPYEIWQRYLRHFESIVVVGRGPEQDITIHKKYLKQTSGPRVRFELVGPLTLPMSPFRTSRAVRKELRKVIAGVDGVVVRLPSEHGLEGVAIARELQKPYAVELVGCALDALWHHGDWRAKVYAPFMAWRVRRAVRHAPFVNYVTREFLQRRYPAARVRTGISNAEIPTSVAAISDVDLANGVVGASVDVPQDGEFGRSATPFTVGMIGAFQNAYKGHESALRAIARSVRSAAGVRLKLVGVGDASRWQKRARELGIGHRVEFEGVLEPGAPVFRWLKRLDLYIQPSLTEGLPRALIEAMACGCPALASSAGGIPELLEPACLHRPGDWRRLSEQITAAANDRTWLALQGSRNRLVAATYSAPVLDAQRTTFWSAFAEYCNEHRRIAGV
jgi:glycosyltransferase involved in cell wall biosynthesis